MVHIRQLVLQIRSIFHVRDDGSICTGGEWACGESGQLPASTESEQLTDLHVAAQAIAACSEGLQGEQRVAMQRAESTKHGGT